MGAFDKLNDDDPRFVRHEERLRRSRYEIENKSEFNLLKVQIDMMSHAMGLNSRNKKPYRNYYNTGRHINRSWEDLKENGLAIRDDTSPQMGGYYYHISDYGLRYVLKHADLFGLDKRIKKFETLDEKCN